jgi:predicted Zn-dependent protease
MRIPATAWVAPALAALAAALGAGCGGGQAADGPQRLPLRVDQEIEIGRAAAPSFEKRFGGRLDDPAVQAYVRAVGERVARCTAGHGLPYQFIVLDAAAPGAFALPGGPVYVTRGLLERLTTEGQLAAALAHLLAHVNARHVGARLCEGLGAGVLGDAARAAMDGRGVGAGSSGPAPALERVAAALATLCYSTEVEAEADRLGLDYVVAAGYHPGEMVRFLNVLVAMNETGAPDLPRTHPNPDNRIGGIRDRIEQKYEGLAGRVADEEYGREVLKRLHRE